MHILNEVYYLITSIATIHFLYGSAITSQEHLKRSICQGHCVYLTTRVVTMHYNKLSVLIRENLNEVYLRKYIVALLFRCLFIQQN